MPGQKNWSPRSPVKSCSSSDAVVWFGSVQQSFLLNPELDLPEPIQTGSELVWTADIIDVYLPGKTCILNKREPPEEAKTQGGGWGVVQESLVKFLEVKKLNEFEAFRRLMYD